MSKTYQTGKFTVQLVECLMLSQQFLQINMITTKKHDKVPVCLLLIHELCENKCCPSNVQFKCSNFTHLSI